MKPDLAADASVRIKQIQHARDDLITAIGDHQHAAICMRAIDVACELATGVRQPPPSQYADLMRFYGVTSIGGLVDMQAYHIEQLQKRVRGLTPAMRVTSKVRA